MSAKDFALPLLHEQEPAKLPRFEESGVLAAVQIRH